MEIIIVLFKSVKINEIYLFFNLYSFLVYETNEREGDEQSTFINRNILIHIYDKNFC